MSVGSPRQTYAAALLWPVSKEQWHQLVATVGRALGGGDNAYAKPRGRNTTRNEN